MLAVGLGMRPQGLLAWSSRANRATLPELPGELVANVVPKGRCSFVEVGGGVFR